MKFRMRGHVRTTLLALPAANEQAKCYMAVQLGDIHVAGGCLPTEPLNPGSEVVFFSERHTGGQRVLAEHSSDDSVGMVSRPIVVESSSVLIDVCGMITSRWSQTCPHESDQVKIRHGVPNVGHIGFLMTAPALQCVLLGGQNMHDVRPAEMSDMVRSWKPESSSGRCQRLPVKMEPDCRHALSNACYWEAKTCTMYVQRRCRTWCEAGNQNRAAGVANAFRGAAPHATRAILEFVVVHTSMNHPTSCTQRLSSLHNRLRIDNLDVRHSANVTRKTVALQVFPKKRLRCPSLPQSLTAITLTPRARAIGQPCDTSHVATSLPNDLLLQLTRTSTSPNLDTLLDLAWPATLPAAKSNDQPSQGYTPST
nr:hypothetical protein CFP56_11580 [Quercus suber]